MFRNIPKNILNLLLLYGLLGLLANLAHPVTPALMKLLNQPKYMFGLAFATMQLSSFLFSPFWGTINKKIQPRIILLIGCVGYAIGQLIFGLAINGFWILVGRVFSGVFVSAVIVTAIYTLVQISTLEQRKIYLPILITSFTVMGTFGQFIGGYFGEKDLLLPIFIQVSLLIVCAILFYLKVERITLNDDKISKISLKEVNPVRSFVEIRKYLSSLFIIQFIIVFLSTAAQTAITQTFAYYLVDIAKQGSSVNGNTRAIVGVISVLLNSTLTIKIVQSRNVEKNISYFFIACSLVTLCIAIFSQNIWLYLFFGVLSMVIDTIFPSVLQDTSISYSNEESKNVILGAHNSFKSLGAITGALFSGIIYEANSLYPFYFAAIMYFASAFLIRKIPVLLNNSKETD